MIRFWPLLFIIVPLVELYLIIKVGAIIGALWTVILVVLTAVIGVNLLRYQGFSTLRRAQQNMAQGQLPAMEMLEGVMLAIAGVLLLTPGFLTDALGFFLLLGPSRMWLARALLANTHVSMHGFGQPGRGQDPGNSDGPAQPFRDNGQPGPGRTIEGEFERKD